MAKVARGLFGVDSSLLWLLTEFRSRVMHLICLVSDLLISVCVCFEAKRVRGFVRFAECSAQVCDSVGVWLLQIWLLCRCIWL